MTTGPSIGIAITPGDELSGRPVGSRWSGKRLFIAILLFLNLFITFMQQIILSVAAPAIARDFRWDAGEMGLLFSSYQWTYCLFLLVWGPMSDRIGTHWINGLSVTIWSIAGMLTGVAATFGGMLATRLALGAGEAASFPTSAKVVRQWFPASERGLATAIFNAGTFAGPAFSAPLVAWLLLKEGGRMSFMISGSLSFLWVVRIIRLQTPYGEIKLVQPKKVPPQPSQVPRWVFEGRGIAYLAFVVADVDEAAAKLKEFKIELMSNEPVEIRRGITAIFAKDPEGNFVEFVQYADLASYRPDLFK
jgi:MFS family permease